MLCDKIQDNLSAYIDGEAGPQLTAEVDQHLRECGQCRAMLEQLRKVSSLLNTMPQHTAPSTLAEDVQSRLERQMLMDVGNEPEPLATHADRRLPQRRPAMWPRVAAVAACLLLVAGITALLTPLGDHKDTRALAPEAVKDQKIASADSSSLVDKDAVSANAAKQNIDDLAGTHLTYKNGLTSDGQADSGMKEVYGYPKSAHDVSASNRWKTSRGSAEGSQQLDITATGGGAGGQANLEAVTEGRRPTSQSIATQLGQLRRARAAAAGDNTLYLVASDAELGEEAINNALAQAGVLNARQWRTETAPLQAISGTVPGEAGWTIQRRLKDRNAKKAEAVNENTESVEVITIEAEVDAAQAATLNLLVANSDTLTVGDRSNGIFAQAAPTQRMMQQVPRDARYRMLADNEIIRTNMMEQQRNLPHRVMESKSAFRWTGQQKEQAKAEGQTATDLTVRRDGGIQGKMATESEESAAGTATGETSQAAQSQQPSQTAPQEVQPPNEQGEADSLSQLRQQERESQTQPATSPQPVAEPAEEAIAAEEKRMAPAEGTVDTDVDKKTDEDGAEAKEPRSRPAAEFFADVPPGDAPARPEDDTYKKRADTKPAESSEKSTEEENSILSGTRRPSVPASPAKGETTARQSGDEPPSAAMPAQKLADTPEVRPNVATQIAEDLPDHGDQVPRMGLELPDLGQSQPQNQHDAAGTPAYDKTVEGDEWEEGREGGLLLPIVIQLVVHRDASQTAAGRQAVMGAEVHVDDAADMSANDVDATARPNAEPVESQATPQAPSHESEMDRPTQP